MSPINLVSIVSEQLWPTIHCLAHYGSRIQRLFLLHTNDESRSIRPAKSIAKFVSLWKPEIKVIFPRIIPENSSTGISKALHEWMDEFPDSDWVINASGGTKLMMLGVLDFANLPNVEVIYRDLTGNPGEIWHSVQRSEEFGFLKNAPISIDENATDLIPVEILVKTIWSDHGNFLVEFGQKIPDLDVEKVTRIASLNNWDFKKAFQAGGYPAENSSGQLFEQYVVSILINLGVRNITCNAVRSTPSKKALSEIDIIANHQGNLTVIDCKMRSLEEENLGKVETLFEQIRKANQMGKELGGLGAKVIILRPNRTLSENESHLAESYRVKPLDAPKMSEIIDCFAKHFGIEKIPDNLINVQNIIQNSQKNQFYPGMGQPPFKYDWDPNTRSTGILNVNSLLGKLQNDLNQNWAAFEIDTNIYIDFAIPNALTHLPEENLRIHLFEKMNAMFGDFSDVEILSVTKRKARCELQVLPGQIHSLKKRLGKMFGRPIL